jgi:cell wall-associated NlpC family hydrolase
MPVKYSLIQFVAEVLISWAVLYFMLPILVFKADYIIRSNNPETLLYQVSGLDFEDFTVLAEQAAGRGGDEMVGFLEELRRLQSTGAVAELVDGAGLSEASLSSGSDVSSQDRRAEVVRTAKRYIGTPYRWGGEGPSGFDCSGYVQYVYRRGAAVELPRSSSEQYSTRAGRFVGRSSLRAGELVFFATQGSGVSHVGMYIGDLKFIHAPSSGNLVRIDSLNDPYYWKDRFVGAKSYL